MQLGTALAISLGTCPLCVRRRQYSLQSIYICAPTLHYWAGCLLKHSMLSFAADALMHCLQRTPDKVSKQGDAHEQSEEKREVIGRLRDVLQSCHTLLEKTSQVPINGDVNLLQHILK